MSDKKFIAMGAECVAGDLTLNRVVVGQYRNGQFILTEEGVKFEGDIIEVPAVEVKEPKPKKAKKVEVAAEVPAPDAADEDPLASLNLDA